MTWLLVLIPLAGAGVVAATARRPAAVGAVALTALAATCAAAVRVAGTQPTGSFRWSPALTLQLDATGPSRLLVVLVPVVALAVATYTVSYLADDAGLSRFVAIVLAFVAAMELLALAADFLSLLLAWEVVGACSWALIGHEWRHDETAVAARAAFVTTRVGDLGLYAAAGAALAATGSLRFDALPAHGWEVHLVAAGVLLAAAAKSAQLPFSPWLFSAMAGPTPASALLHSATMVAAGAFLLAKLTPSLGAAAWLAPTVAWLGLATAIAGGVVASVQHDLKRALAASTSAQYGLMLVAIGAGGAGAGVAHLGVHAAFKALLFLAAGVAIHVAGTGDLAALRGTVQSRAVALLFALGALALAAVPPTGGAASKDAVLAAALHDSTWLGAGVLLAGLLSAFYAARLQLLGFRWGGTTGRPTPRAELAGMGILAVGVVAASWLWLPAAHDTIERIGGRVVEGRPWEAVASVATVLIAVGAAVALGRRDHLLDVGLARSSRTLGEWLGLPAAASAVVVRPTLAFAHRLAELDDRVVDAGVRAAAATAAGASRALAWWGERGIDGAVVDVARAALATAIGSRRVDESLVDGAVERTASGVGVAGRASRRIQSGLAHQYLVIVVGGAAVVALVGLVGRI